MEHTGECSRRKVKAEQASGINLNLDLACPRCRLNAGSPELLEACQRALAESVGQPSRRISQEGLNVIRAAISKATT